jgi:hypothetical protein
MGIAETVRLLYLPFNQRAWKRGAQLLLVINAYWWLRAFIAPLEERADRIDTALGFTLVFLALLLLRRLWFRFLRGLLDPVMCPKLWL